MKEAFFDALRRRREMQLAQGNVELLEDLRRRIQVQVNVGEAARLELTRAEAEVASARIAVRSAELRQAAALSALYAAVGSPLGKVEPDGDCSGRRSCRRWRSCSRRCSPNIRPSPLRNPRSSTPKRQSPAKKPSGFPHRVSGQIGSNSPRHAASFWRHTDDSGLEPREGQIAEAEASRRQATAIAQSRRVQLLAALERAYSMYQVADQQVQIAETGTVRQAEAAVEAARAAFKFGERGIIEVLDAQRSSARRATRLSECAVRPSASSDRVGTTASNRPWETSTVTKSTVLATRLV